jgi:endo-1,4-beta-xylanase
MNISRIALWRACLLACAPIAAVAQVPVVIEAESGALGASLTTGADGGTSYITVQPAANSTEAPTPERTATYSVTFPAPGNYALYVRFNVGPVSGSDDSFFIPNGFNTITSWAAPYNSSTGGSTTFNAIAPVGGPAGQGVWKWQRMTPFVGIGGGIGPSVWVVPPGQLTQTFAWASREDGLLVDKFAFGNVELCYRVVDLDFAQVPNISCPVAPGTPPPYTREGQPLATGKDKFLGSAWSPGAASLNFGAYWNQVTPENAGKWASVERTRDVYDFAQAHQAEDQANAVGGVFKWHVLFWGNQQPAWLWSLTPAEQLEEIHEWLAAIKAEFPGLQQIEVVNEPLHDRPDKTSPGNTTAQGGSGGYYDALGGAGLTGHDWIINAFTLARQYFPNAKLMLNDYSITNSEASTTSYLQIIDLLKDRGLIDLIGIQGHAFEFNYNNLAQSANTHSQNLARLAQAGLPVYVTEFDLDGVDPDFGILDHRVQFERYQALFPVFWDSDAVKGITLWGYVENNHWRNNTGAWLMHTNGAERPALQWLVKYAENNRPVVTPGQTFSVSELAGLENYNTAKAYLEANGFSANPWEIEVAVLMLENPGTFTTEPGVFWTGGLINYDGSNAQRVAFLERYGKTPVAGREQIMQRARQFLEENGYGTDDTRVLTATLMIEHESDPPFMYQGLLWVGGLANYNDSNMQALAFSTQYPNPPPPGRTLGFVLGTDPDAADRLSNWQIGGDGTFVMDRNTGAISLAPGKTLDFEGTASYRLPVFVSDGTAFSKSEFITINVTNVNDNAPAITAGQSYRIDGGRNNTVAKVLATDGDDQNQPGFTSFSGWTITSGNTNNVFRYHGTGNLQVNRPLLVDWRKSSYSLGSTVSDGATTSPVQAVQVTIPNRVNLCLLNAIRLEAPKATAPLLILLGADLGACR